MEGGPTPNHIFPSSNVVYAELGPPMQWSLSGFPIEPSIHSPGHAAFKAQLSISAVQEFLKTAELVASAKRNITLQLKRQLCHRKHKRSRNLSWAASTLYTAILPVLAASVFAASSRTILEALRLECESDQVNEYAPSLKLQRPWSKGVIDPFWWSTVAMIYPHVYSGISGRQQTCWV